LKDLDEISQASDLGCTSAEANEKDAISLFVVVVNETIRLEDPVRDTGTTDAARDRAPPNSDAAIVEDDLPRRSVLQQRVHLIHVRVEVLASAALLTCPIQ
jgi:hypothetical protein